MYTEGENKVPKQLSKFLTEHELVKLPIFSQHLNIAETPLYLDLIQKHFKITETQFNGMEQFDKAVVAKIAHWIEFYAEKFTKLEEEFQNLNAQYCLIATLSAIEGAIGVPFGEDQVGRVYDFFRFNLKDNEIDGLTKSIYFYDKEKRQFVADGLRDTCNELINMRHGLLHRAELVYIPTDDLIMSCAKGRDIRKLPYDVEIQLHPRELLDYTKTALSHYFTSGVNRKPKRMLDKIYPAPHSS